MARREQERKTEAAKAAAKAAHKDDVNKRVSIAALLLTMMLSFLGFARASSDSDASGARAVAQESKSDAATEWSLYQTKTAQRSGFLEAEDGLSREVLALPDADPRRRLARFHHRAYEAQVKSIDDENRQVFFLIQTLNRRQYVSLREAAHHDRRTVRYDMGIRTLTLALVLISVTLLVDRAYLFWLGLLIAATGAGLAVSGYFLQ
jgi:hypothetical protein